MTPHDGLEISRATPGRAANGLEAAADARLQKAAAARPGTRDAAGTPGAGSAAASDQLELSLAARALSTAEDPGIAARLERHAAGMRAAIEAGELASSERVERAVRRLLGG